MSEANPVPSDIPAPPRPPVLLERLLSPQGIHALLGAGGLLFVIGLVTWLATLGIFDQPLVLAGVLAAGNLVLLGAGFWLVLNTRYQLAGLAVTLLACLVMPLHLWFYHAQNLLTLEDNLWAAALVIALLYAVTARVLRHWMFVPVFLGGVALTSLLILADLGEFWQVTAPAFTLCLLGLIAIHVERFFPVDERALFPRKPFGLAFFWSGHALLGLGLLMVLIAQLAGGPLYETYTKSLYQQWNVTPTELVTTTNGKWLALFLVLAGVYAHLYSDLIVRRKGYYLQIAAGLVLWIEFLVIDLLDLQLQKETLLGVLAGTGIVLQLLHRLAGTKLPMQLPILAFLAVILCLGASLGGLLLYVADGFRYFEIAPTPTSFATDYTLLLVSMFVALAGCVLGMYTSREQQRFAALYQEGVTLTALLVGALAIALAVPQTWFLQYGSILGLATLAVLAARQTPQLRTLGQSAHIFVVFWIILGLRHLLNLGGPQSLNVAGLLGATTGFYLLAALLLHHQAAIPCALIAALAALVHLFAWWQIVLPYKLLAGAALGAVCILVGESLAKREHSPRLSRTLHVSGQWLFFIFLLTTGLLGLQHLLTRQPDHPEVWAAFNALLAQATLALFFAFRLKRLDPARGVYLLLAIAHLVIAGLLMVTLLDLPMWRKAELASIALGVGLSITGFIAWAREEAGDPKQSALSPTLLLGTMLIGVPMALVVLNFRTEGKFHLWDEASMLIVGLLLLAAGCVCQLRIPTIAGLAMTLLYIFGLLLFVRWGHLDTAALILAGGGAVIFLLGLALSIFRDRLLALPTQVKERRGIFQVLGWR